MKLEFFIARRLSTSKFKGGSSRVMTPVAVLSVAISVAVVLISGAVISGFKSEISSKVTSLAGDVVVRGGSALAFSGEPMVYDSAFVQRALALEQVDRVEALVLASAIVRTEHSVQGVALRGVQKGYDPKFLQSVLVDGALPDYGVDGTYRDILISVYLSDALSLKTGDVTELLFIGDNARQSRFRVVGLYDTGMVEFDKNLVFAYAPTVIKVGGLDSLAIDSYQVHLKRPISNDAAEIVATELTDFSNTTALTTADIFPQIYDWLSMLDLNAMIVMIIMLAVAGVNMICSLLVIVLESRQMVGVLLSEGIRGWSLQQIFVMRSCYITFWGLLWGNLLALGLCLAQSRWGLIELDSQAYMLSSVPIDISWGYVLMVDVLSFILLTALMMIPTTVLSRLKPDSSLKTK